MALKRNEKLLLLHRAATGQLTKAELLRATGEDQIWFDLDGTICRNLATGETKTPEQMRIYMQEHGNFMDVTLNLT